MEHEQGLEDYPKEAHAQLAAPSQSVDMKTR